MRSSAARLRSLSTPRSCESCRISPRSLPQACDPRANCLSTLHAAATRSAAAPELRCACAEVRSLDAPARPACALYRPSCDALPFRCASVLRLLHREAGDVERARRFDDRRGCGLAARSQVLSRGHGPDLLLTGHITESAAGLRGSDGPLPVSTHADNFAAQNRSLLPYIWLLEVSECLTGDRTTR